MQLFEILLLSISTFYLGFHLFSQKTIEPKYISGVLILVLLVHLLVEGYRWQMLPAYLLWVIAFISGLRRSKKSSRTFIKVSKGIGLSLLLIIAIFLPSVLPVFDLPKPEGPYSVGTRDILLELNREEEITK